MTIPFRTISVLCGIGLIGAILALIVMLSAIVKCPLVPQAIIELVDNFGYVVPFGRTIVALELGLSAELLATLMRFTGRQARLRDRKGAV